MQSINMRLLVLLVVIVIGCLGWNEGTLASDVNVDISGLGEVRGRRITLQDEWYTGKQTDNFLGIPYGADTSGEHRFQHPRPRSAWRPAVHDGTILGDACPQSSNALDKTHPLWNRFSEDCLNLNIHAPSDRIDGGHPVMVWFHGGAYISGANIQYPGHFLAANDVVVVVVNYRLDIFGFLSVEDPDNSDIQYSRAPGNAGLMDQRLALQWVQDNIGYFGGNKDRVTIFGQSAGASSSSLHMVSPGSQNLFHQVIAMSGTETAFWAVNWPSQNPNNYARQVAQKHSCSTTNIISMITCLKAIPFQQLEGTNITCAAGHFCQGFAPIIDGVGGFLPDYPQDIRDRGEGWKGPTITGLTRDDGSLYTAMLIPESLTNNGGRGLTHEEFHHHLRTSLLYIWEPSFTQAKFERIFTAIDWFYSDWPHIQGLEGNRQAFNKLMTDFAFGMPADRQGRDISHGTDNTYWYVTGVRPENTNPIFPQWMGVPNSLDLPYVWGWPLLRHNMAVRKNSEIIFDYIEWTCEEDAQWSVFWQKLWTNFAKTGNPTSEPVYAPRTVNSNQRVSWPSFEDTTSEEDKLNYLYADNTQVYTEDAYRQRDFEFFRTYLNDMIHQKVHHLGDSSENNIRKSARGMSSATIRDGLEKHADEMLYKKFGKDRYIQMSDRAMNIKSWEEYKQLADDLVGPAGQC